MAIDFSMLPPELPMPNDPPSRLLWTVVFFVLTLAGVFAVLLLWPKTMPTQTWQFWVSLIGFPVAVATLVILRRYSMYEGLLLDVEIQNEVNRDYIEQVFSMASRPLAVTGAACRFLADAQKNKRAITEIATNALSLKTQTAIAADAPLVKARWLVVPDVKLEAGTEQDDRLRQQKAMRWIFAELLNDLAPQIQLLPQRLPLAVHLVTSSLLRNEETIKLWKSSWLEHQLRHTEVEVFTTPPDLIVLDHWLDHIDQPTHQQARLIVAVQLHLLLSDTPPEESAEAGVAVLLVPDALIQQHKLSRIANLHRPVRGPLDQSNDALAHALKWAKTEAANIGSVWQTGLNAEQAGMFRQPAMKMGLTVPASNLDTTVGQAGITRPWLAIACAIGSKPVAAQLIVAGHVDQADCTVLLPASPTTAT